MRTATDYRLSAIWSKWVGVVLLRVLWLAGCQAEIAEPAPAATVTSSPAPATAPAVVASTPTRPVASPTLTLASILTRFPTLLPTTPALSPTASACSYQAQFVRDVTIPDDTCGHNFHRPCTAAGVCPFLAAWGTGLEGCLSLW